MAPPDAPESALLTQSREKRDKNIQGHGNLGESSNITVNKPQGSSRMRFEVVEGELRVIQSVDKGNIRGVKFEYSPGQVTAFGHRYYRPIWKDAEQPIEYWRAQLAFRGCSPKGHDIEVMKSRLQELPSYLNKVHLNVIKSHWEMIAGYAWRVGQAGIIAMEGPPGSTPPTGDFEYNLDDGKVYDENDAIVNEDDPRLIAKLHVKPWDISGKWKISLVGGSQHHILDLFTQADERDNKRETYGKVIILAMWRGMFIFLIMILSQV